MEVPNVQVRLKRAKNEYVILARSSLFHYEDRTCARFKNVGRSWQTTHAGAGLLRPTLRVDAARYRRAASVRHARRAARERARLRAARHAALRCCIFSPH